MSKLILGFVFVVLNSSFVLADGFTSQYFCESQAFSPAPIFVTISEVYNTDGSFISAAANFRRDDGVPSSDIAVEKLEGDDPKKPNYTVVTWMASDFKILGYFHNTAAVRNFIAYYHQAGSEKPETLACYF